ncbi:hypothetical protein M0534_11800 [Methylonatrum kenyense]|uniref:lipopolysaccharide kinase InaA family protein n=1 Tax=Methylonatrum kenyense TaxID=455253 RepID=UPI0020BFD6F9|nr:lipopolysaccharide kinase InaA family protein [Methylonatrum kenyense]MCK8517002.1 hypothetical protein [Methylonatrum kenyense]
MMSKQTVTLRASGFRGEVINDHDLQRALAGDSPRFQNWPRTVLKHDADVESGFIRPPDAPYSLFYKRYPRQGWRRMLGFFGITSRARHVWHISRHLHARGVPIARPVGYLDGRRESWFFCEALEHCRSFNDHLAANTLPEAEAITEKVTRALAALHDADVVHRDFKWGNILWSDCGDVVIADLDGARRCSKPERPAVARDLARFLTNGLEAGLKRHWALDFISRYCALRGLDEASLLPAVAETIDTISRRHRKRYGRAAVSLN